MRVSNAPKGIAPFETDQVSWRKSSFSGADSSCVEVAFVPGGVALRDTKDRSLAPHLFDAAEWSTFLAGVANGEFDSPQA